MSPSQNIAVAAVAGVLIVGGTLYVEKDNLGFLGGGLHSVDFRNTPVEVVGTACADPQLTNAGVTNLPLHDGAYQLGQYQFELVGDVRYGDVSGHTGDNNNEKAVFVGSCSTAGKTSQVLFVYGMQDGKPERVASLDFSAGGVTTLVQSYAVDDGAIQVKANQGDPPALVTLSYALLNGNLVSLNPANSAVATQTPAAAPAPAMPAGEQTPAQTVASDANNEDSVNYQSFHDSLAPYGQWINHPRWGTVWHPTQVPADFAPYRQGHWENTDEYGTVWVSDYGWGDIAFHYGRWGYDPNYGWLWQPGYVWSPAWVAWRQGAGDIGWFPIPPGYYDGTRVFVDDWYGWYGYRDFYGAALDAAAFYALWSFVPADAIYAPSINVALVPAGTYVNFIGRTRGWTRFGVVRGHLFNRAIDPVRFRATFGHPLPVGVRHDFMVHHGPIVSVARGRVIAARQVTLGHPSGAIPITHHVAATHFGSVHHTSYSSHSTAYSHYGATSGFSHSTSSGSGFSHSSGSTRPSGYGSSEPHSTGFAGASSHPAGFGGTTTHSEPFGGANAHSGGFGGGTAPGGFGGGSNAPHPGFGGGAYEQHSTAMGAPNMQRPPSGGGFGQPGGIPRPVQQPQVQRPPQRTNNEPHH